MRRRVARWFSFKGWFLFAASSISVPSAIALQLTVAWDPVVGATGYKVERSTNNILFTEVASVSSSQTSYTDSNLATGSYSYRVRAFNSTLQSDYSNVASYASTDVAPAITKQPSSQTATVGGSVTFGVTATGSPTPTFQWQKDGVVLAGATSTQLTLPSVTDADAASYTVVVSNAAGSVTSSSAALTVSQTAPKTTSPTITTQPLSVVVNPGSDVSFSVTATGSPAPTYEWRKDGVALSGATASSLALSGVSSANAGTYTVVVSNSVGSVTSSGAVLSVETPAVSVPSTSSSGSTTPANTSHPSTNSAFSSSIAESSPSSPAIPAKTNTASAASNSPAANSSPSPSSRLSNASIRATGGSGDQVLIVGLVIDQAPKSVLLRAVGPGLASYTTATTFADPKLTIFDGSTPIASNDNWGGSAALKTAFKQTGAQALEDNSKDAAIVTTLGPKPYTMMINGTGAGMTLAEVYGMDSSGGRIVNIAARAQVSSGDGVLIAGFTITGNAPKQVLLRGIGPSLAALGVSGVLAHPQIDLFRGTTRIDHNNAWGGGSALKAAFAKTGAFTLSDPNSSDAALLVTLDPGTYSVIVSSENSSSGVALVEVYDVP